MRALVALPPGGLAPGGNLDIMLGKAEVTDVRAEVLVKATGAFRPREPSGTAVVEGVHQAQLRTHLSISGPPFKPKLRTLV